MFSNLTPTHYIIGLSVLVIVGVVGFKSMSEDAPGAYDMFASCIAESGTTFYGAFWCPHCADQKELFGNSAALLPYVECSMPNGQAQTAICIEEEIQGYPTWEFPSGERVSRVMTLGELAEKTNCALPN